MPIYDLRILIVRLKKKRLRCTVLLFRKNEFYLLLQSRKFRHSITIHNENVNQLNPQSIKRVNLRHFKKGKRKNQQRNSVARILQMLSNLNKFRAHCCFTSFLRNLFKETNRVI